MTICEAGFFEEGWGAFGLFPSVSVLSGFELTELLAKFMPLRITPPSITPIMTANITSFRIVFIGQRIAV